MWKNKWEEKSASVTAKRIITKRKKARFFVLQKRKMRTRSAKTEAIMHII
jgi:hypothetical protein